MPTRDVLLGNAAIGRGLLEAGCQVLTAYPGTPSTEILPAFLEAARAAGADVHVEWSINEKVALEVALAASWAGLRSAAVMKQVGLNVAADPLLSAAYTGVVGGFAVVVADDPGPHSSQTEQDTRLFARFAKVPILDPSSPRQARRMAGEALEISERHSLPVILRPTTRVCHGKQSMDPARIPPAGRRARFQKDPDRWAATPRHRYRLHRELNEKLRRIAAEFDRSGLNVRHGPAGPAPLGVLAAGVASATALDLLEEWGLADRVPVLEIGTPYPFPRNRVASFLDEVGTVLVLEEPDAALEAAVEGRARVRGRGDDTVPDAGELSPEVVHAVLAGVLSDLGIASVAPPVDAILESRVASLELPVRRPSLCPGCGHRSAFFAIRRAARGALYPGDIGCYTLGTNLRAVDTVLDMGASINLAAGFHHAFALGGSSRRIVATIGDSTFFHSGLPGLANAVHTGARFTLVVLDNSVTAMTGFQPTHGIGALAGGGRGPALSIAALVEACGVRFVRRVDPYDGPRMETLLEEARAHTEAEDGGVAVILAERPCSLADPSWIREDPIPVAIDPACDGCRYCLAAFECPALVHVAREARVEIDRRICVDCGECLDACRKGLIAARPAASEA